jgi:hypothetical protein
MTNDPISNWLNQVTVKPEIVEAHEDITHYLEETGALFLEDTDINELDATWMLAIAISNLYHFIRKNPSQIPPLKQAYIELRRARDVGKLEHMWQKEQTNNLPIVSDKTHEK